MKIKARGWGPPEYDEKLFAERFARLLRSWLVDEQESAGVFWDESQLIEVTVEVRAKKRDAQKVQSLPLASPAAVAKALQRMLGLSPKTTQMVAKEARATRGRS